MKRRVQSRRRGEYEGLVWAVFGVFLLFGALAMTFASRFIDHSRGTVGMGGEPTSQPHGMGLSSEPGSP